jgi:hypothetical protein
VSLPDAFRHITCHLLGHLVTKEKVLKALCALVTLWHVSITPLVCGALVRFQGYLSSAGSDVIIVEAVVLWTKISWYYLPDIDVSGR